MCIFNLGASYAWCCYWKSVSYFDRIGAMLCAYVWFNVIHRQTRAVISCTVSGERPKRDFHYFPTLQLIVQSTWFLVSSCSITCAHNSASIWRGYVISIGSRFEGIVHVFCVTMFGSKCVSYLDGIGAMLCAYVWFDLIHRQTRAAISCTVSGERQKRDFQLFN